jgi:hypothetical protein
MTLGNMRELRVHQPDLVECPWTSIFWLRKSVSLASSSRVGTSSTWQRYGCDHPRQSHRTIREGRHKSWEEQDKAIVKAAGKIMDEISKLIKRTPNIPDELLQIMRVTDRLRDETNRLRDDRIALTPQIGALGGRAAELERKARDAR